MDITQYEKEQYHPTHFMTVYSNENNERYIEVGPILKQNNTYHIGASHPVDMEFLNDLVDLIKVSQFKALRFKGLIPSNVLYVHSENQKPKIIWHRKPEKRQLFFSEQGLENGEYDMPGILFCLNENELQVYRIDLENLNDESKLYKMPLPNIYQDGQVCLGSTKQKLKKPKCLEEVIDLYEDLFYKTSFNMLHDHHLLPEGIVYIEMAKNKNINEWPVVSTGKTIKSLLK